MRMQEGLEIDSKDLRLIHNLYWNQEAAVRVVDKESETQSIKRGVRQGCVMFSDLFNYYNEIIMRDIRDMEEVKVGDTNITT